MIDHGFNIPDEFFLRFAPEREHPAHVFNIFPADVPRKMPGAGDIGNDCVIRLQPFGQALWAERIRRRAICAAGDLHSLMLSAHIAEFSNHALSLRKRFVLSVYAPFMMR